MFGIWCEVWGGRLGPRASWLCLGDEQVTFDDLGEAERAAANLQAARNGNPHRVATFRYTAMRVS